jgi:DNA gyrase subunit A
MVRTRAHEIATTGRNAQGVRLIRLGADETLVGLEALEDLSEELDELLEDVENTEITTETQSEVTEPNVADDLATDKDQE